MTLWLIIGILGGTVYKEHIHLFPLFLSAVGLMLAINSQQSYQIAFLWLSILCFGLVIVIFHPVYTDEKYFLENEQLKVEGEVVKIAVGNYSDTLTLQKVKIEVQNKMRPIRAKITVRIPKKHDLTHHDRIIIIGTVIRSLPKMNPSDKDYIKFLRSQGVSATLQAERMSVNKKCSKIHMPAIDFLSRAIDMLYEGKDQGVMKTLLIGDKDDLSDDIYTTYSRAGIGHVLAISGFHIALLISVMHGLLSFLGIPYTPKYLSIGAVIWIYGVLTGASISTLRACIMATIIIAARCIWEEEDLPTSLAFAAAVLLIINPFQLYQAGFQLSFTAVASLLACRHILSELELRVSKKCFKILSLFMPWITVTLGTYPVLAVHFYEIPFISSLLNLFLIPVFSVIIVLGWLSLVVSTVSLSLALFTAQLVVFFLNMTQYIGEKVLAVPLATLCTGKPEFISLLIYYGLLNIVFFAIIGYIKKEIFMYTAAAAAGMILLFAQITPNALELTYLYIGQGDAAVIQTPGRNLIMIDGGDFGKGKTLERYVKYRGHKTISAFILSHSDADHIGGLIELLDQGVKVNRLFISKSDTSDLMNELLDKCRKQKTTVYAVGSQDEFYIDNIQILFLTPFSTQKSGDNNNNSLGCLLRYKHFSAVFTGDMDQTIERQMSKLLDAVTVLKVSHHGSRTGTSEELILRARPEIAVISCGLNNRYNHPHKNTLDTLGKYHINLLRTDQQGAVSIRTNGEEMSYYTQIKGDSYDKKSKFR